MCNDVRAIRIHTHSDCITSAYIQPSKQPKPNRKFIACTLKWIRQKYNFPVRRKNNNNKLLFFWLNRAPFHNNNQTMWTLRQTGSNFMMREQNKKTKAAAATPANRLNIGFPNENVSKKIANDETWANLVRPGELYHLRVPVRNKMWHFE